MGVSVVKLIAAISPDVYCSPTVRDEVKALVKTKGYLAAAEKAELIESTPLDYEKVRWNYQPYAKEILKNPVENHIVWYEASGNSLEPIYFWTLDVATRSYKKVDKIVDNYVASPGSSQFSEMGMKATRMHDEATKMLGAVNQVIKSILNMIYDLKEWKLRLGIYDDYHSKDKKKKEAALLSLKQIWMDNVDIRRGQGSINAMAQQLDFVTLRDGFMIVESLGAVDNLDLNDRVKRILKQRVSEFFRWIEESESETRKRYDIEKNYLKSQINTVKMYSRWLKPYLKAAKALEQQATPTPSLVTAFNTTLFELTLLGQLIFKVDLQIDENLLPKFFKKAKKRDYFAVGVLDLKFRSIPERASQQGGYGFSGKVEAEFTSFGLNSEEIKVLKQELEKDDFGDMYKAIEGATDESLGRLQADIDEILEGGIKEDEKAEEDVNPFFALFSFLKSEKKAKEEKKEELPIPLKKDSDIENVIRARAALLGRRKCYKFFNSFKSAHGLFKF